LKSVSGQPGLVPSFALLASIDEAVDEEMGCGAGAGARKRRAA
jgi:hypothetical protein